jgi:hypothetical protein
MVGELTVGENFISKEVMEGETSVQTAKQK